LPMLASSLLDQRLLLRAFASISFASSEITCSIAWMFAGSSSNKTLGAIPVLTAKAAIK